MGEIGKGGPIVQISSYKMRNFSGDVNVGNSSGKGHTCNSVDTGDTGLILASRRSPGGGHRNPLQYFFAWVIPWREEPGGLQFIGHKSWT